MKACVAAVESTCQSAVEALPRRFGRYKDFLPPLPFSVIQHEQTRFDGGSELDVLREEEAAGAELTEEQLQFLEKEDTQAWRRPTFPLRDCAGVPLAPETAQAPRESTWSKRIDAFSVARCPVYRRRGGVTAETSTFADGPALDRAASEEVVQNEVEPDVILPFATASPAQKGGMEISSESTPFNVPSFFCYGFSDAMG